MKILQGYSALYSGDIGWPIQEIPKSDINSNTTYSNLESSRDKDYIREDAINKLLGLISIKFITQAFIFMHAME